MFGPISGGSGGLKGGSSSAALTSNTSNSTNIGGLNFGSSGGFKFDQKAALITLGGVLVLSILKRKKLL